MSGSGDSVLVTEFYQAFSLDPWEAFGYRQYREGPGVRGPGNGPLCTPDPPGLWFWD